MWPTIQSGSLVLEESLTIRVLPSLRPIERGDLVSMISPLDPRNRICKRVVGLAGDEVLADARQPDSEWVKVPQGHLWVLGDNPDNSADSRMYGPVSQGLVRGRVLVQVCGYFLLPAFTD